ncbi:12161_t:CDS:2 [Dentiscutata erythropus]|uniref:12161_t:CDS:1 n=1 Tax=Dentiscutata erythropus TaxID=1348616 RepID=A0A9N9FZB7_9GLOM|nr:12161_t:CDS:2 [Dentiscutata erythropus]
MALHLEIILESELQVLIDLIKTTQNDNTYVQYGVYIKSCAKRLGWQELKFISESEIVKTISNAFSKVELSSNDLLLSGILDIETLDTPNSPIKKALQGIRLWDNVKETLLPKQLPDGLKKFIKNQFLADNALIPDHDNRLYQNTLILIDSIKRLWRIPSVQSCSTKVNESSWAHYVLQPIVNFIVDFLESDIFIRWDTITSKASLERNNEKGPIKKNDIYGVYEIGGHLDLELMLGEISNGPFNRSSQVQVHIKKDRIKLAKCGKDALDFVINKYAKSHNYDDLVKMQKIKVYLLHAHETVLELFIIDRSIAPLYRMRRLGIVEIPFKNNSVNKLINLIQFLYTFSIHIEENLRLIKEIFNENLDNVHISNYYSEDNDRNEENEEENIFNDGMEDECEEIKMFTYIPTYNTPRSSIN